MTKAEIVVLVKEMLACYDEPDSPEAFALAVEALRKAVNDA